MCETTKPMIELEDQAGAGYGVFFEVTELTQPAGEPKKLLEVITRRDFKVDGPILLDEFKALEVFQFLANSFGFRTKE